MLCDCWVTICIFYLQILFKDNVQIIYPNEVLIINNLNKQILKRIAIERNEHIHKT